MKITGLSDLHIERAAQAVTLDITRSPRTGDWLLRPKPMAITNKWRIVRHHATGARRDRWSSGVCNHGYQAFFEALLGIAERSKTSITVTTVAFSFDNRAKMNELVKVKQAHDHQCCSCSCSC